MLTVTNHIQTKEYLVSTRKIGNIYFVRPFNLHYERTLNHVIVLFLLERKEFEGYLEM